MIMNHVIIYYLSIINRGVFSEVVRQPPLVMGASFLPVVLFSAIWAVVGIVLPFMVPRGPHKSVIQVNINSLPLHQVNQTEIISIPIQFSNFFIFQGCLDVDWRLLLVVLALLLHEPDESSDWTSLGAEGLVRHEEGVGRHRGLRDIIYY